MYFFLTTPFYKPFKANGKQYEVGQSFNVSNCTEVFTCMEEESVGCVSLCSPK